MPAWAPKFFPEETERHRSFLPVLRCGTGSQRGILHVPATYRGSEILSEGVGVSRPRGDRELRGKSLGHHAGERICVQYREGVSFTERVNPNARESSPFGVLLFVHHTPHSTGQQKRNRTTGA